VDAPGWASESTKDARLSAASSPDVPLAIGDPHEIAGANGESLVSIEMRDSTATWAPMDPSMFQQDTFQTLDPGTLTTWGEPEVDSEDPDANWPPEAPTEVFIPDIDTEEISKWLPAPEERPVDELEYSLEAVDLAAEDWEPGGAPDELEGLRVFGDLKPEPPDPTTAAPARSPIETRATEVGLLVEERASARLGVGGDPEAAGVFQDAPTSTREQQAKTALDGLEAAEAARASPQLQRDPGELREIEAGLTKFQRVVQVNPKNARAWDTLGNLYKSAGQYKEALESYQEAIRQDATKAIFHHHVGLVYACEGRMDEAIDAFQRVLHMDPDHALAHAALGGYFRKKGLEDLAQQHIGIAMKSIFDSENEYNRACLAAICGNTEQALDLLRVALQNKQTYVDWILRDPDLDFIRQDPRFKQLISDYAG